MMETAVLYIFLCAVPTTRGVVIVFPKYLSSSLSMRLYFYICLSVCSPTLFLCSVFIICANPLNRKYRVKRNNDEMFNIASLSSSADGRNVHYIYIYIYHIAVVLMMNVRTKGPRCIISLALESLVL